MPYRGISCLKSSLQRKYSKTPFIKMGNLYPMYSQRHDADYA